MSHEAFLIIKLNLFFSLLNNKIPLVQVLPLASVAINVYLMMTLAAITWLRFALWFLIGLFIYYTYGIRNSSENVNKSNQSWLLPCMNDSSTNNEEELNILPKNNSN
jgi:hypothetical protein